jgi:hypothetical protein
MCAPEILPKVNIMIITIKPHAADTPVWVITPVSVLITIAPVPQKIRKNVAIDSAT